MDNSNLKPAPGKNPHSTGFATDPLIFFSVLGLVLLIVLAAVIDRQQTGLFLFGLQDSIVEYFSWLFSLTVTGLLVFSFWLAFSRFGHIKLGPDDSEPEFNTIAWVSMLFSAGMGIGLVFFKMYMIGWNIISRRC